MMLTLTGKMSQWLYSIFYFLKETGEEIFGFYLKIKDPFLINSFTIIFYVLIILLILLTVKQFKEYLKLRGENKRIRIRIEKLIMKLMEK